MRGIRPRTGIVLILLVGLAGLVALIRWKPSRTAPAGVDERSTTTVPAQPQRAKAPAVRARPAIEAVAAEDPQTDSSGIPRLSSGVPPLSREQVEEYLRRHHRNAQSLLAAFHALDDTNYLQEAATNFPNDPQLQWTILARNAYPEEQRKWLDLFKASSPDNSLANYLSASDLFRNGQINAALDELRAATQKPQFKDYVMESRLDEEELYLTAGKTQLEATRVVGWAGDLLPEQASLKGAAYSMQDLQKQFLDAGDPSSAVHLAQIGVSLARRFNSGAAEKLGINQMVGIAMEAMVLEPLDQNATYEFLGGKSPAQRLDELKQQRVSLQALRQSFKAIYPNLTEAELLAWKEREKIFGEIPAMRWVQQQRSAGAPTGGN